MTKRRRDTRPGIILLPEVNADPNVLPASAAITAPPDPSRPDPRPAPRPRDRTWKVEVRQGGTGGSLVVVEASSGLSGGTQWYPSTRLGLRWAIKRAHRYCDRQNRKTAKAAALVATIQEQP